MNMRLGNSVLVRLGLAAVAVFAMPERSRGDNSESGAYARDVLPISSTRILVALWDGGVAKTDNGGLSWKVTSTAPLSELALGSGGSIWGFYAWAGIHEPSSAALVHSKDGGSTFEQVQLDANKVLPVAFVHSAGSEPIILTSRGELWQHAGTGADLSHWQRIAQVPSQERFSSGIAVRSMLYAADSQQIWLSKDQGKHWESSSLPDVVGFAHDDTNVWAVRRSGKLYRTAYGSQRWRLLAQVRAAEKVFRIVVVHDGVYLAGQTAEPAALSAQVTSQGQVHVLERVSGQQAVSVRAGPDGALFLAAQGVFRARGAKWYRVWPGVAPAN